MVGDPASERNGTRTNLFSDEETDQERQDSERRCEELAAELFYLEKRLMEPSRRLLEHTAGILQLSYKEAEKNALQANSQPINGIPASPESLYGQNMDRGDLDVVHGDRSFAPPIALPVNQGPDVPMKSPVREQLREEADRSREENAQLVKLLEDMEQKFEGLNRSLRETIVRFNPSVNDAYDKPPQRSANRESHAGELLQAQLDYLETGLVAVQVEQQSIEPRKVPERSNAAQNNTETAERIETLNTQLREVLMAANPDCFPTPVPVEPLVDKQLAYLGDSLGVIDSELRLAASGQSNDHTEIVLLGLWDRIQTGYANIKQQNIERRRARAERGMEPDEDVSEDEEFDATEQYSIDSFSERIEWLYHQATLLKDQKSVLKRQIKQQRELNNKSDAEKDEEIARRQEELEQSRLIADRAEKDATDAQRMLSDALQDLEDARASVGSASTSRAEMEERSAKIVVLENQLIELKESLAAAESEYKSSEDRLAQITSTVSAMRSQIEDAERENTALEEDVENMQEALQKHEAQVSSKNETIKQQESELEQLSVSLAELKTEVTIARAELDGAYGTRAERAADVAAVQNSAEAQKLQNQMNKLKKELEGTVKELEDVTKETISSEREKTDLEIKLDEALTTKTHLHNEALAQREASDAELEKARAAVHQLQEQLDGERLKALPSPGGHGKASAGTTVLSEQFRATMRGERKKFQEDLRVRNLTPPLSSSPSFQQVIYCVPFRFSSSRNGTDLLDRTSAPGAGRSRRN